MLAKQERDLFWIAWSESDPIQRRNSNRVIEYRHRRRVIRKGAVDSMRKITERNEYGFLPKY